MTAVAKPANASWGPRSTPHHSQKESAAPKAIVPLSSGKEGNV